MDRETDYKLFRGKCHELASAAVSADPRLTLQRGTYHCPIWNRDEPHWWCVQPDGKIFDPSKLQFPSAGLGIYTPFSGQVSCEECGKELPEEQAVFESRYAFCSHRCLMKCVGLL